MKQDSKIVNNDALFHSCWSAMPLLVPLPTNLCHFMLPLSPTCPKVNGNDLLELSFWSFHWTIVVCPLGNGATVSDDFVKTPLGSRSVDSVKTPLGSRHPVHSVCQHDNRVPSMESHPPWCFRWIGCPHVGCTVVACSSQCINNECLHKLWPLACTRC